MLAIMTRLTCTLLFAIVTVIATVACTVLDGEVGPISMLATPNMIEPKAIEPTATGSTSTVDEPPLGSAAAQLGPPQTLEMLIAAAPLIVIGEIGPIEQYLDFAVYGSDGALVERGTDAESNLLPDAPATDFLVLVEDVLRDDGRVSSGEAIILRMPGIATQEMKQLTAQIDYPFSYTGDRHLFLLTPNPDGASYGFYYGPWSRLNIEDDALYISNGQQQPLHFANRPAPITLDEFMEFVKD